MTKYDLYICKKCYDERLVLSGSDVWCSCRPRVRIKMKVVDKELQKIMKIEKRKYMIKK